MGLIKEIIYRIRGEYTTEKLIEMGMTVGSNFKRMKGVILDPSHCWLIEIGDNVTLAPMVHVLCHDASTKNALNYTKIGKVKIGNNVFIGAHTVILPNTVIGSNVIVGANSTVTHNIPDNSVVAGSPAKLISTFDEYIEKEKSNMKISPIYGAEYTLRNHISEEKKQEQKTDLEGCIGYIE